MAHTPFKLESICCIPLESRFHASWPFANWVSPNLKKAARHFISFLNTSDHLWGTVRAYRKEAEGGRSMHDRSECQTSFWNANFIISMIIRWCGWQTARSNPRQCTMHTYLNCSHSSCRVVLNNHHLDIPRTIAIVDTHEHPPPLGLHLGVYQLCSPVGELQLLPTSLWRQLVPLASVSGSFERYLEYVQFHVCRYIKSGEQMFPEGSENERLGNISINSITILKH